MKNIGIKIIDNNKFTNGYGEAVCLILTQLLDKYLINQNFIFKKPKFDLKTLTEEINEDSKIIVTCKRTFSGKKFNSTLSGNVSI